MADVPAGYILKITTWENDGDNYKTSEITGLSKEDVPLYLHLVSLFKSRHGGSPKGIGNSSVLSSENLAEKIFDHFESASLPLPSALRKGEDETDNEFRYRLDEEIFELIGVWMEGEYYRVFERAKIFFVKSPIQDVTYEFTRTE
jgi:hypothetical protein